MHISQINDEDGARRLVARVGDASRIVRDVRTLYDLATAAIARDATLAEVVEAAGFGAAVDLERALAERRVLAPIEHPDPAHLWLTGTGLTHLGSAATRDEMHAPPDAALTDSMKMFRMGLENGKPETLPGVQPEWFYKGDGSAIVAPGAPLESPAFAGDGGEEPEVAGVYLIGPDGQPRRLGYALANEFSDHVTERINYLYLAHSKLRPASIGPELLVGPLPEHVSGISRILRGGAMLWEKPFVSGEANMSHAIANLEHHHFKYGLFRRPGDVHVHMFGTATLSCADGIETAPGDVFEIEAPVFGLPLRNPLTIAAPEAVTIRAL